MSSPSPRCLSVGGRRLLRLGHERVVGPRRRRLPRHAQALHAAVVLQQISHGPESHLSDYLSVSVIQDVIVFDKYQ